MRRPPTKATRGAVTKEHGRNADNSKSERPRRTNGVGAKRAARVEPRGPANDRTNTDQRAEARCLRQGAWRPADSVPERSLAGRRCLGLSNHRQAYDDEHQRRFWRKPLKDYRTRKMATTTTKSSSFNHPPPSGSLRRYRDLTTYAYKLPVTLVIFFPCQLVQNPTHFLPDSVLFQAAEMVVDVLPLREMAGQHAPLATRFIQVKDGVDDFPAVIS